MVEAYRKEPAYLKCPRDIITLSNSLKTPQSTFKNIVKAEDPIQLQVNVRCNASLAMPQQGWIYVPIYIAEV